MFLQIQFIGTINTIKTEREMFIDSEIKLTSDQFISDLQNQVYNDTIWGPIEKVNIKVIDKLPELFRGQTPYKVYKAKK